MTADMVLSATSPPLMSTLTQRPHILFTSTPIYAHFEKLHVIAGDLVRRGYKVTFLTGSVFCDLVQSIGADFLPLSGAADFDGSKVDDIWPERAKLEGAERFSLDLRNFFISKVPSQYETIQKFLTDSAAAGEHVVVIQDTTFFGNVPVLLGAPGVRPAALIAIGIAPLPITSIDTAPFNTGLPPDSSPEGRGRNAGMNAYFRRVLDAPQVAWTETLKSLGATNVDGWFFDDVVGKPDYYLQLCLEEEEYPRSDAPKSLRYIGPLLAEPPTDYTLPSWWDMIVKHQKPLIVVSQGTIYNTPAELIIPTITALKDLDVLVVATLLGSDSIKDFELPTNARVMKSIPFSQMYKHADVAISTGGYPPIQQAFGLGVPMILAGMSEDKPEANARLASTGAAINLATQKPEVSQLRDAVEKVLSTSTYKARAQELKRAYAKTDACGDVAAIIKGLASGVETIL